jgi:hypothetical protein
MQAVRGLVWLQNPVGAVATGAEDGQLCVWMPGDNIEPTNGDAQQKQAKKRRKG